MSTSNAHYRRAQQLRRVRSRRNGGGQIPLRLVICGAVFVLLVAAKLLFPEAVGRLADSARQLIGRDADFKEAFAAMGRAVSGEGPVGDSLQEAYSAVFNPADPAEPEAAPTEPEQQPSPQPEPEDEVNAPSSADTGAQLLRHSALPLPEADKELMREEGIYRKFVSVRENSQGWNSRSA